MSINLGVAFGGPSRVTPKGRYGYVSLKQKKVKSNFGAGILGVGFPHSAFFGF